MFDVADSLMRALTGARSRLADAADATARAQTPYGAARSDTQMATVAQHALFTEALLSAAHARLAEIKSAAHG